MTIPPELFFSFAGAFWGYALSYFFIRWLNGYFRADTCSQCGKQLCIKGNGYESNQRKSSRDYFWPVNDGHTAMCIIYNGWMSAIEGRKI